MQGRLLSIDVFRGMTIFFMIIVNTLGSWKYAYSFLLHAKWDGLTPTDLVFPFFMFIVGLAMAFSFSKYEQGDRSAWVAKVLRRTLLIFLIGMFLNWFPFYNKSFSTLRFFGVLQRIALGYGIAGLLLIYLRKSWVPYIIGILLFGYWGILHWFGGTDPLSLEGNAVRALDLFLVGEQHVYKGYGIPFDPEGLLSTIPSIATVLFGYLIGELIKKSPDHFTKIKRMGFWGMVLIGAGLIWHYAGFPINKPIWSSSYVLITAGLGTLLLALFIFLIDIKGWEKWAFVFRVFGLNPLISYVISGLIVRSLNLITIDGTRLYPWIYANIFQPAFGFNAGSALQALTYTLLIWLIAWWLYRKEIIIKL
jgi:predicted acyltransferase